MPKNQHIRISHDDEGQSLRSESTINSSNRQQPVDFMLIKKYKKQIIFFVVLTIIVCLSLVAFFYQYEKVIQVNSGSQNQKLEIQNTLASQQLQANEWEKIQKQREEFYKKYPTLAEIPNSQIQIQTEKYKKEPQATKSPTQQDPLGEPDSENNQPEENSPSISSNDLKILNDDKREQNDVTKSDDQSVNALSEQEAEILIKKLNNLQANELNAFMTDEDLDNFQVNTTERVKYGQPSYVFRDMKILTITQYKPKVKLQQNYCTFINTVNFLNEHAVNSTLSLFEKGMFKVIMPMDALDDVGTWLIKKKFPLDQYNINYEIIVTDSDYDFLNTVTYECEKILYLQSYFSIIPSIAESLISRLSYLEDYSMEFTLKALVGQSSLKEERKLKNLCEVDLDQGIMQQELNQYVFLFDPAFLRIVTPLNFAFYNKYTIQEMVIYPILALLQHSTNLRGFEEIVHTFEKSAVQFKEFVMYQPQEYNKDMPCFLAFPDSPSESSSNNLELYLKRLSQLKGKRKISVIIFAPYKFKSDESLWKIGKKLIENKDFLRLRMRIRANQTVSSLGVYESAYTYCPEKALIISSRRNVQYREYFLEKLQQALTEKYHLYFSAFLNQHQDQSMIETSHISLGVIRSQSNEIQSFFRDVQIFRSDLFKMVYFWILKCKQIDFYETEASFMFPMLEMVALQYGLITQPLYKVSTRQLTQKQIHQFENLRKYQVWPKIRSGRLTPYAYNALENIAFRRFAHDRISKNIHQIWIGDHKISQIHQGLQATIIQKNPDYQMYFWTNQNLTVENFPYTYGLIWRAIEYERLTDRSYSVPISSLIRYEALLRHGGIYIDFKTQCRMSLDPFLKYEIFFIDAEYDEEHYQNPQFIGNGLMGACKNSYYIKMVLTQLITEESFDFEMTDFPKIVGGFMLRKAFNNKEFFTVPGFGFHLFTQKPGTGKPNQCQSQKAFSSNQKVFQISDYSSSQQIQIGIPCNLYEEAYLVPYYSLVVSHQK